MEIPILLQLAQTAAAVALGAALAFLYDCLHAVPFGRVLWEVVYCLLFLTGLLLFALYVGLGEFRLFFLPCILLGATVYFRLLCAAVRRVFAAFGRILRKFFRKNEKKLKNSLFNMQKIVYNDIAQKQNRERKHGK